MNRKLFWAILTIGVMLVVAPIALSLPSKAGAGEHMLNGFEPIMQPAQVQTTAYYYNDVFTPLGKFAPLMSAKNLAKLQGYFTDWQAGTMTPTEMKAMQRDFGGMLTMMQANAAIFSKVPAGLAHYKPLVTTMQANVDNYRKVNSLPSFHLFTWFFVVPGIALVLLAGWGLFARPIDRPHFSRHARPTGA
jgi:hypothetical protein